MTFARKSLLAITTFFLLTLLSSNASTAQGINDSLPEHFDAEVSIQVCPEFQFGGIVIDVFYRIGADPGLIPAEIISSTMNNTTGIYKPVIRFPSFYGTTPFSVVSFCRSFRGFSPASNARQVSNCDSLARFDSDGDGIPNNLEDTNCDNFFSPGDASNPFNVDTDGDGVRDLVELVEGTDPSNPGRSPRPFIFSGGSFDPDGNGASNPVIWRPSTGTWFIRGDEGNNQNQSFNFGINGDIPFTYRDRNQESNVGIIRLSGTSYQWLFRGKGFGLNDGRDLSILSFGIFGDNIIPGPWEKPGVTNPATARLFNGAWSFHILLSDGTVKNIFWGGNGDLPKPQDFDGDGIFDVAVFRPSDQKTYILPSSQPGTAITINFGSGTADHTVRGDYSGDGKDEISFWEPLTGKFTSLLSDHGFDSDKANDNDPLHLKELTLGEYFNDLPLSWNFDGSRHLYTVINHKTGVRKYFPDNDSTKSLKSIQWGLPGDSQG
ncbi:MAG TPA: hypothetical protein PKA63_08120 [Oligoflexia bacterium]|nr:hypothetical protein [Oligoflexia bacterium]HMP48616.1 hypothetical protein [Oligoflexia bacterium]